MGSAMQSCKSVNNEDAKFEACQTDEPAQKDMFLSPISHLDRDYQSDKADFRKQADGKVADREILSSSPVRKQGLGLRLDAPHSIISGSSNSVSAGVKKQFPDGSCYIGECNEKGVPHGRGKFVSSSGDVFEGEFQNGRIEGRGSLTDKAGNRYVGTFKDSLRHGKGVEKMATGDIYEGQFLNDKRCGYGTLYKFDKAEFSGNFDNNQFDGYGTYTWPDKKQSYEGNWKNGKMHGRGKLTFENGDFFQGEFVDGVREGNGVLRINNGRNISGRWEADRLQAPDVSEVHS